MAMPAASTFRVPVGAHEQIVYAVPGGRPEAGGRRADVSGRPIEGYQTLKSPACR